MSWKGSWGGRQGNGTWQGYHQHARHEAGASSRVLPGNLPASADFSSLISPPWQRLEGCEGCADEGMVVGWGPGAESPSLVCRCV